MRRERVVVWCALPDIAALRCATLRHRTGRVVISASAYGAAHILCAPIYALYGGASRDGSRAWALLRRWYYCGLCGTYVLPRMYCDGHSAHGCAYGSTTLPHRDLYAYIGCVGCAPTNPRLWAPPMAAQWCTTHPTVSIRTTAAIPLGRTTVRRPQQRSALPPPPPPPPPSLSRRPPPRPPRRRLLLLQLRGADAAARWMEAVADRSVP